MDVRAFLLALAAIIDLKAKVISAAEEVLSPVAVKLVGGDDAARGRVDVLYKGVWGTLCVRDMNKNIATVICKMMGQTRYLPRPSNGKTFQADNIRTPYWVVNGCNGTERTLAECGYLYIRSHDKCEEVYDHTVAGVDCHPSPDPHFQVRLVNGGSRTSGVVELFRQKHWGTVCGKKWGLAEAEVVCRRLGHRIDRVLPLTVSANFSTVRERNRGLAMTGLECEGRETTMRNCVHRPWGDTECEWGGRAAVDCEPSTFPVTVSLVGGKKNKGGWVQVRLLGRWANLVSSDWSGLEATVVCRKLGHWWGSAVNKHFDPNVITEGAWVSDIRCSGNEKDLNECGNSGWSFRLDKTTPLAVASCYHDSPRPALPIVTGKSDDLSTNTSLKLVCRSNAGGEVSIRWVCHGQTYATFGPRYGTRVSLPLEIGELTPKHNNLMCECKLRGGRGWEVVSKRELHVQYEPSTVTVTQLEVVPPGEVFGLQCQSGLANPPVELVWMNGSRRVDVSGRQYTMTFLGGVKTFHRWFVRADAHMNGQMVTCVALSPVTNVTTFDSVVLAVGQEIPDQGRIGLSVSHFFRNIPASVMGYYKAALRSWFTIKTR